MGTAAACCTPREPPRRGTTPRSILLGVDEAPRNGVGGAIVDPEDRSYVDSLAPGPERDAVVVSLLRYRRPEALQAGDPLPTIMVRGAGDLEPVELADLVRGRPLLLVFGSYT